MGHSQTARAPVNTHGERPPTTDEWALALRVVLGSGLLAILDPLFHRPIGRPRSLTLKGLLVGLVINAMRKNHVGQVVAVARVLNSLSPEQLAGLGMKTWDPSQAYDRVDRAFNALAKILDTRPVVATDGREARIDESWFADRILDASVSALPGKSRSVAVDGTDIETWGALHGDTDTVRLDGSDPPETTELSRRPSGRRRAVKAKVLGVDPDGRSIYTADPDARSGHRSATASRPAGPYIGYEAHLGVQTRDVVWTDNIDRITLGPDVAPVITIFRLTPAGAHRGDAIVPALVTAGERGLELSNVVWDRGYSQLSAAKTTHPLTRAGISQTFSLKGYQRARQPFTADSVVIDGQLFSAHLPDALRQELPMPPMGASEEVHLLYEAPFNERARFRYGRHAGPDAEGTTRWRCPLCSGYLRARQVPKTMRRSATTPLVNLPEGATCCGGIVSVSAAELPWCQPIPFGTTAWRIAMGRRQVVEGANAGLKGGFVNAERKFLRVLGRVKVTILLAATIAGYNLEVIRSFTAKRAGAKPGKAVRAKRRTGTYTQILGAPGSRGGDLLPDSGPDPPD